MYRKVMRYFVVLSLTLFYVLVTKNTKKLKPIKGISHHFSDHSMNESESGTLVRDGNSEKLNNMNTDFKESTEAIFEAISHHLTHKEYIQPSTLSMYITPSINCSISHTMLLLVYSVTQNSQKRDLIRTTWGDMRLYDNMIHQFNLQLVFVFGEMNDIKELEDEAAMFGDLWVGRFKEDYIRLARKGAHAIAWVNNSCNVHQNVDFVFKTDDDVYVNLFRLLPFMWRLVMTDAPYHFVCAVHRQNIVFRDGKYSESRDLWPYDTYPTYCSGIGYFISKKIFPYVVRGVTESHLLTNEDAFITGACLNITRQEDKQVPFIYHNIEGSVSVQSIQKYLITTDSMGRAGLIFAHHFSDEEWISEHNFFLKNRPSIENNLL